MRYKLSLCSLLSVMVYYGVRVDHPPLTKAALAAMVTLRWVVGYTYPPIP